MNYRIAGIAALSACLIISAASAKEIPIGEAQEKSGLRVGAVYLQPIEIDAPELMRDPKESDFHVEADITAAKGNAWGIEEGLWFPGLVVQYELTRLDDKQTVKGDLVPDIATDGFAYCNNIKLPGAGGAGKYKLTLTVSPPSDNKKQRIARHVDKENGVPDWFKPFSLDYEFTYAGTGKKGAY
ncbi:iron transporter [Rhodomicrobium lacus]|jgi:uncharacterized protein involved in high-affinity Fe2+ transport|uniref:iron transporter n=1 Tax=Rhodomicrobium lacus TaxID=2498452 RepID=UPI000F8D96EB|nr:iron transporter [Rhodomicrobium lacus]WKW49747.1 iron transporter [Rhodomicrobium lacus]